MTDDQKKSIAGKQEVVSKMMADVKADRDSKQLYQDPKFNLDKIISDLSLLKSETDAIFNAPPPKPKSPEKAKEEDTKMESSDKKEESEKKGEEDQEMKAEGDEAPKTEEPAKE